MRMFCPPNEYRELRPRRIDLFCVHAKVFERCLGFLGLELAIARQTRKRCCRYGLRVYLEVPAQVLAVLPAAQALCAARDPPSAQPWRELVRYAPHEISCGRDWALFRPPPRQNILLFLRFFVVVNVPTPFS